MARLLAEEVLAVAKDVDKSGTIYTDAVKFRGSSSDVAGVKIISSAGSITVTQQVSTNKIDWDDAVNGSNSALGAVAATMTVGTRYVQYSPVICPFIRFKIVEGGTAASKVTLTLVYQEDTV